MHAHLVLVPAFCISLCGQGHKLAQLILLLCCVEVVVVVQRGGELLFNELLVLVRDTWTAFVSESNLPETPDVGDPPRGGRSSATDDFPADASEVGRATKVAPGQSKTGSEDE